MVKMSVKVRLPLLLRQFATGQEIVEVAGYGVMECLNDLTDRFPDMRRWLFTKQGEVAIHVRPFINGEQASAAESLKDGDELLILLAVSGG